MQALSKETTGERNVSTEALLKEIQEQIEDRKGEQLVILDMRDLSTVTDFFVLTTGNSAPHLRALAEQTEINLKKAGHPVYRKAGDNRSDWYVLDYVDVVVHIMSAESREFYDLETLWSDAPVIYRGED